MRRLVRAFEVWIWLDVAIKLVGILTVGLALAATWMLLVAAATVFGL